MRMLLAALLSALAFAPGAAGTRAAEEPTVLLAPRPDGCARITVVNDATPWRFATLERSRDGVIVRAPVAYFEDGAALACFEEPFAADDYLQAVAYRYDDTSTAVSIGGAWEPYAPPTQVYLPQVAR